MREHQENFVTNRPDFQKMAKESKQKGNYKGRHVGTLGMKKMTR